MHRGLTGQYYVTPVAGETIRAFVPHPLPPEPPLEFRRVLFRSGEDEPGHPRD